LVVVRRYKAVRNEKIFFKTVSMYIKGKHYSTLSILGPPQSQVCVWDWKWGAVLGGETCHRKHLLHLQKQVCAPARKSSPTLLSCPSHFAWQMSEGKPIFLAKGYVASCSPIEG
jgi:hypothetical protein